MPHDNDIVFAAMEGYDGGRFQGLEKPLAPFVKGALQKIRQAAEPQTPQPADHPGDKKRQTPLVADEWVKLMPVGQPDTPIIL